MRFAFTLIITIALLNAAAQVTPEEAPFIVRCNMGIPKPLTSRMFHTSFNGIYEVNLSFSANLSHGLNIGLGYQNVQFQNNKNVFVYYKTPTGSLSYNTRLMGHCGYLRLGYDKSFSKKGYMAYALNAGIWQGNYFNVVADTSSLNAPYPGNVFAAGYVQPEIGVHFNVERTLSFSVMLSYTTVMRNFDPRQPRFNHFTEVRSAGNSYPMSYFTLGFGFNILIARK